MRIDGRDIDRIQRAEPLRRPQPNGAVNGTSSGGARPLLSLSPQAQSLGDALHQAHDAPSMQAARVASLKQQVEAGTYHVPTQALAERLGQILP